MSLLDHYNPYKTNSEQDWDGLHSAKFGRTRAHIPHKDLITTGITYSILGLNFPSQDPTRGKKHFDEKLSP